MLRIFRKWLKQFSQAAFFLKLCAGASTPASMAIFCCPLHITGLWKTPPLFLKIKKGCLLMEQPLFMYNFPNYFITTKD